MVVSLEHQYKVVVTKYSFVETPKFDGHRMVMVGLMLMRSSVVSVETDKKAVINTGMDEFVCDDKSTTEY